MLKRILSAAAALAVFGSTAFADGTIMLHFSGVTSKDLAGKRIGYAVFQKGTDISNITEDDIYYINQTTVDENGIFKLSFPFSEDMSSFDFKSNISEGSTSAGRKIYVSNAGSDKNSGTSAGTSLKTLEQAFRLAAGGDTIVVNSDTSLAAGFKWPSEKGTISLTSENGSAVDISAVGDFNINSDAVIDKISFKTANSQVIFANGHNVTFGTDYTTGAKVKLYGGSSNKSVDSTNMKVLGGSYVRICGGSTGGSNGGKNGISVRGDVNLHVGGNANKGAVVNDDLSGYTATYIYGGGYNCHVGGSTNITLDGNAAFAYVFGGTWKDATSDSTELKIGGSTNITINGGRFMNIFGGTNGGALAADTNIIINGGSMEAVFGGNQSAYNLTGNANIYINGGEITRRIYGGCYHSSVNSDNSYVAGNINMVFSGSPKLITKNGLSGTNRLDGAIIARSRLTNSAAEIGTMIFNDGTYDSAKSFINASDLKTFYSFSYNNGCYDYLVTANSGGRIIPASKGTVNITPDRGYAAYIGNTEIPAGQYALTAKTTNITFKRVTGISGLEYSDSSAKAEYALIGSTAEEPKIIIAVYDSEGTLKAIESKAAVQGENGSSFEMNYVMEAGNQYTVRAFLWDCKTLKSLGNSMMIDVMNKAE